MPISCIVEGHGEVEAVPLLIDRLARWLAPARYVSISRPPIRVKRDRFLNRDSEFDRYLRLAGAKCGDDGWVLIVLDADDDCPAELGAKTLARARSILPDRRMSVVLANREFEAWFIAAAESLDGCRGLDAAGLAGIDPEVPRNAEGRLSDAMDHVYRPLQDQPRLAARMNLAAARERSRSFRKLCDDFAAMENPPTLSAG